MLEEQPVVARHTSVKWSEQFDGTDLDSSAFLQAGRGSQSIHIEDSCASRDIVYELVVPHFVPLS